MTTINSASDGPGVKGLPMSLENREAPSGDDLCARRRTPASPFDDLFAPMPAQLTWDQRGQISFCHRNGTCVAVVYPSPDIEERGEYRWRTWQNGPSGAAHTGFQSREDAMQDAEGSVRL